MIQQISKKIKKEHYTSSAVIVWCFDARFSGMLDALIKKEKMVYPDKIKLAGGAKSLASPDSEEERMFLLGQIEKSVKLHHPKTVYLMMHSECGAYGKKFDNYKDEKKFYISELRKAEKVLKSFLKERKIKAKIVLCFADFDGILY